MNAHDGYVWPLLTLVAFAAIFGAAVARRRWDLAFVSGFIAGYLLAVVITKVAGWSA